MTSRWRSVSTLEPEVWTERFQKRVGPVDDCSTRKYRKCAASFVRDKCQILSARSSSSSLLSLARVVVVVTRHADESIVDCPGSSAGVGDGSRIEFANQFTTCRRISHGVSRRIVKKVHRRTGLRTRSETDSHTNGYLTFAYIFTSF